MWTLVPIKIQVPAAGEAVDRGAFSGDLKRLNHESALSQRATMPPKPLGENLTSVLSTSEQSLGEKVGRRAQSARTPA